MASPNLIPTTTPLSSPVMPVNSVDAPPAGGDSADFHAALSAKLGDGRTTDAGSLAPEPEKAGVDSDRLTETSDSSPTAQPAVESAVRSFFSYAQSLGFNPPGDILEGVSDGLSAEAWPGEGEPQTDAGFMTSHPAETTEQDDSTRTALGSSASPDTAARMAMMMGLSAPLVPVLNPPTSPQAASSDLGLVSAGSTAQTATLTNPEALSDVPGLMATEAAGDAGQVGSFAVGLGQNLQAAGPSAALTNPEALSDVPGFMATEASVEISFTRTTIASTEAGTAISATPSALNPEGPAAESQTGLPGVSPEFDAASAASDAATGPVPALVMSGDAEAVPEMTATTDPVDEVEPNVSAPDATPTSADAILSANGLAAPQAARVEPGPVSSQAAVQTPVGDPGWPDDLGEQVNWMLDKTIQNADIRLNPQHLGPLQVHIRMENNQMSIQFSSEHAAVRDALEAASPQLKEMLANQQITVNDVSVNTPTPSRQESSNFMAGFDRQPRSPYQQDDAPGSTRSRLVSDEDDTTANISVIPSSSSRSISLYA